MQTNIWDILDSGHCFLHSIITAFNADIPRNEYVDMDSLKRKLQFETSAHSDVYRDFIDATGSTGTHALQKGLYEYIIHKKYNTSYGDFIDILHIPLTMNRNK